MEKLFIWLMKHPMKYAEKIKNVVESNILMDM
jgi:hypothetical protein